MKQVLLLITCMFILSHASAQEEPKQLFATVNAGGSLQKDDLGNTFTSFSITPSINYLLNERWSIGFFTQFNRGVSKMELGSINPGTGYSSYYRSQENKLQSWWVGPQARYYYPVYDNLFLFAEAQAGLKFESLKTYSYYSSTAPGYPYGGEINQESRQKIKAVSVQSFISPGIVYFVKPNFGIEIKVSVLQYNHGIDDSRLPDGETKARDLKADFSLTNSKIGASFYF